MSSSSSSCSVDYYTILRVSSSCSSSELSRSYRQLALLHHPDKNIHNKEEAEEQFKTLQRAYDVLSDPHQRAWYDSHKESILRGFSSVSSSSSSSSDVSSERNSSGEFIDPLVTSLNLNSYLLSSCFEGYDSSNKKNFYTVFSSLFVHLAEIEHEEDRKKSLQDENYEILDEYRPEPGDSTSSDSVVHTFYSYWSNFISVRSFSFADEFNPSEAQSRHERRAMEAENKKLRTKRRKEYNELIRNIVKFMKKKDKRIEEIERKKETKKKKTEEQKRQQQE